LLRRRERTQIVSGEDGELEDIVPRADCEVQYHRNDQPERQQTEFRRNHCCYSIPIHTTIASRYGTPKSIFESAGGLIPNMNMALFDDSRQRRDEGRKRRLLKIKERQTNDDRICLAAINKM
jgi:hypothetical protein